MESKKRSATESNDLLSGVKALLLDIEGTTTPITFVKDKLFPYASENVESYLNEHFDDEEVKADIDAFREQAAKDVEAKVEGAVEIPAADASKEDLVAAVVKSVRWQMSKDLKNTCLKALQGRVWRDAYSQGKVKGEVYEDVVPVLKNMVADDRKLYVYSSGSVEGQKLLFGNSTQGDLLELFSGYFDTKIGSKVESDSYKKIAEEMGLQANEVLFLTDIVKEAKAAGSAGVKTCIVVREGNAPLTEEEQQQHDTIQSFAELTSDTNGEVKVIRADGGNEAADDEVVDDDEEVEDDDEIGEEDEDEEEGDEGEEEN